MSKTNEALIVVDVQRDFCKGGSLQVPNGDKVVPVINSILTFFNNQIFTRDYHPMKHGSFASAHRKEPFEKTMLFGLEQTLWPDHCVIGTEGADFHPDLNTVSARLIVSKGMNARVDSYSAFLENDKTNTGLADYLEGIGVDTVFMVGLAGDYCLSSSAIDARQFGFQTIVVEDAVRSIDENAWADKKEYMSKIGIRFIHSTELSAHHPWNQY